MITAADLQYPGETHNRRKSQVRGLQVQKLQQRQIIKINQVDLEVVCSSLNEDTKTPIFKMMSKMG